MPRRTRGPGFGEPLIQKFLMPIDRSTRTNGRPSLSMIARTLALIAPLMAATSIPLFGQELSNPEKPEDSASSPVAAEQGSEDPGTADHRSLPKLEERNRAYQVGVMMIGGILIAGVGLLALVIIWGHRVRRIARQPLPKVTQRDELWFLKHKKQEPASSADEPPPNDEAAG